MKLIQCPTEEKWYSQTMVVTNMMDRLESFDTSDLMEFIWSIFDRKYNSLCILYRDKSIPLKEKFYSELYLTI